jgi:hypothetical protein
MYDSYHTFSHPALDIWSMIQVVRQRLLGSKWPNKSWIGLDLTQPLQNHFYGDDFSHVMTSLTYQRIFRLYIIQSLWGS